MGEGNECMQLLWKPTLLARARMTPGLACFSGDSAQTRPLLVDKAVSLRSFTLGSSHVGCCGWQLKIDAMAERPSCTLKFCC